MNADLDPALLGRLVSLLADVIGVPPGALSAAARRDATAGWDSVANLQLISAIEEEFGVIIPTATAMKLHSLTDVARFLLETGHGAGARPQPGPPGARDG